MCDGVGMAERLATRRVSGRRRAGRLAGLSALVLLAVAAALLSFGPSIDPTKRPTAEDIALAQRLIERVKTAQAAGTPLELDLDNRELSALSALASDAAGNRDVAAEVVDGIFTARASVPLVAGLWFNASATIAGRHEGFPEFRLKLGRIPLPQTASRSSADLLHWWLRRRGVSLPALDETVRSFRVDESAVAVRLLLPHRTGLVGQMVSAAGVPVDQALVATIYCDLAQATRDEPELRLSALVRQAFRESGHAKPAEYNRAAFVALAHFVVGHAAEPLSPGIDRVRDRCPPSGAPVLLRNRADLAQHWALSAALTAVLGEETAKNLGEWKELHDSLPAGTGFSFVDLAADRSGLHVARNALSPKTAAVSTRTLSAVSEGDLLPAALLEAPEGLSEVDFAARFGGIEAERYRRAVAWIDRQLAAGTAR